jgi:Rrf2 family protein
MRLSKRAEYALRALTAMARRPVQAVSQIEELSAAEGLPPKVLEQILLGLKKADLLRSKRGVGGGYQLAKAPAAITVGEILRAVDGPFHPLGEHPEEVGPGLLTCFTELAVLVNQHLDATTLADVLARESPGGSMHFDI